MSVMIGSVSYTWCFFLLIAVSESESEEIQNFCQFVGGPLSTIR